jgi:hypothetical protein
MSTPGVLGARQWSKDVKAVYERAVASLVLMPACLRPSSPAQQA